jgi:ATP-dependent Lon protease
MATTMRATTTGRTTTTMTLATRPTSALLARRTAFPAAPHRRRSVRASAAAGERRELPIFPLGVVALPHATVPLMIFEPRYRVLFSTLLGADAEGVEQGLVQQESPYAGTREFGMCYASNDGKMAAVGTRLRIEQHLHEADGRIYITSRGTERFRVTRVVKERPVLICEVETIAEDGDGAADRDAPGVSQRAKDLAAEVAETLRNTLRLHLKMSSRSGRAARGAAGRAGPGAGAGGAAGGVGGRAAPEAGSRAAAEADAASGAAAAAATGRLEEDPLEPEELTELAPGPLSYWVAHVLGDARALQQSLLETDGTCERLEREKEVLEQTLRFYSAATALESVFQSDPSSGGGGGGGAGGAGGEAGAVPPPGGPD